MSMFKIGDKVRAVQDGHWMTQHFKNRDFYVVSGVRNNCVSAVDDDEDEMWWNEWHFELVEDAKPAPLIDGPGLYRTRGGDEVTIVGLRSEEELTCMEGGCPYHVWSGRSPHDDDECYRPDGTWSAEPGKEDDFDIVEKIGSTPQPIEPAQPLLRTFASGATRNLDTNKLDYEGFLSPLAIEAFGKYMHSHRLQKDGTMRDSDNWQKGIGLDVYMKSGWRHFFDWWKLHRGLDATSPEDGHQIDKVEALCALMFNVQGYLHELLKEQVSE